MTYDPRYVPAFRESLSALQRAAANLSFTLARVEPCLPLSDAAIATLTPEDRERLDALAARFARCQQMAGAAFKALALLEAEPQARFIDLLALMQKRGLIDSLEAWDSQRDLRNLAGHVYVATDSELAAFVNALAEVSPAVADYGARLTRYAAGLGLLATPSDGES